MLHSSCWCFITETLEAVNVFLAACGRPVCILTSPSGLARARHAGRQCQAQSPDSGAGACSLRASKFTWLVIGPVSIVFSIVNGGRASNTLTLPISFNVNQTCLPSGVAAILGQNGLSWGTRPTI